jgi:hypothetical protein
MRREASKRVASKGSAKSFSNVEEFVSIGAISRSRFGDPDRNKG